MYARPASITEANPTDGGQLEIAARQEKPPTTFGVSGKLWRDALIMYDRDSRSLWSQIDGVAGAIDLIRDAREVGRPFDVVLLDGIMPDGDGIDLGEEIRLAGFAEVGLVLVASEALRQRVGGAAPARGDAPSLKAATRR